MAFAASHGFLQAKVGEELRMKRTPKLEFAYDESVDRGYAHLGAARPRGATGVQDS